MFNFEITSHTKNGFDCQYDKYLDKVNLYERFSLNSDDEVENPLSLKEKLLKTYILNNYINSDKELDGRFLEIISENEIFLQKRLLDQENDNSNEDFEILQLFQDYSYWIMKKAFFQDEIFDMFDFYTMKVLITYATENLGFLFLGLFYDPINQIITKPDVLSSIFSENGSIETLDSILDELIIRSVCLLSIYYMSDSTFYQLTEISKNNDLSFENLQYKTGLFLKEFHDREMLMHGHGIAKHYSYTSEKLTTFKVDNVNT
ncbi:hypothetical protein ACO0OL_003653 [Hanseniaspora opuntiae]